MLEGQRISLIRNDRFLLREVSVGMEPGTMTAILGPNGAGKTTLLRILSGEWSPSEGRVLLDQTDLEAWGIGQWAKRHAFLHQESNLDFAFSVLEVVMLGRTPHMSHGETNGDWEIARKALRMVDFLLPETTPYTRLSGGEKQRVQLARALAQLLPFSDHSGGFLFLDEPTNNLDPEHQVLALRVAREAASEGIGVILVLHDLNLAAAWADRAILLDGGRVVLEDSCQTVLASSRIEDVFRVPFHRITVPGRSFPYLLPKDEKWTSGCRTMDGEESGSA